MHIVSFPKAAVSCSNCSSMDWRFRMSVVKVLRRFACPVALSVLSLAASCTEVHAVTRYFDTNSTNTGSGITAAGSYAWENAFWNSTSDAASAAGTAATTNWTDGDFPRFAAGNDAAGLTYTV